MIAVGTIDDLSAYTIAGRVTASPSGRYDTDQRSPRQGVTDGVEAEDIGFRRVFLSERWNLKEAGALLGGIGALTSRIGLATGVVPAFARHPMHAAAFGATMQAAYGPRFVLGLGRGGGGGAGYEHRNSFAALEDYVRIVRRLWAGEQVDYTGPAGTFTRLTMDDRHDGPDPEIWFGTFGLPRGARTTARVMDGVLLVPNLTPSATRAAVDRLRRACEREGRDPTTLRIAQCVVTAPDLDDVETRQICHARALTYLQAPGWGEALCGMNGWDEATLAEIRSHRSLRGHDTIADSVYHRAEMTEPAKAVPDEWMRESCAIGSVDECLASLRAFREAGADEVVTYGSTPGQNRALAAAWAEQGAAS